MLHLVLLIRQLINILLLSLYERQPVSETLVTQMLIPISEGCDVCVSSLITTEAGYVHSIFIYLLIIRVHLSFFSCAFMHKHRFLPGAPMLCLVLNVLSYVASWPPAKLCCVINYPKETQWISRYLLIITVLYIFHRNDALQFL